jgi:hypothetical protein
MMDENIKKQKNDQIGSGMVIEKKKEKERKTVTFGETPDNNKVTPYLDNNKNLQEGEVLDYDNKAYEMLHRANCEW